MSVVTRRIAWRLHRCDGGHLLTQRFTSAADAGQWRRDHFGADPDDTQLTLVAVLGRAVFPVTPSELCDAQWAWLRPDLANETATGGMTPRPAA